jgi:hypothetical protein
MVLVNVRDEQDHDRTVLLGHETGTDSPTGPVLVQSGLGLFSV